MEQRQQRRARSRTRFAELVKTLTRGTLPCGGEMADRVSVIILRQFGITLRVQGRRENGTYAVPCFHLLYGDHWRGKCGWRCVFVTGLWAVTTGRRGRGAMVSAAAQRCSPAGQAMLPLQGLRPARRILPSSPPRPGRLSITMQIQTFLSASGQLARSTKPASDALYISIRKDKQSALCCYPVGPPKRVYTKSKIQPITVLPQCAMGSIEQLVFIIPNQ